MQFKQLTDDELAQKLFASAPKQDSKNVAEDKADSKLLKV